MDTQYSRCVHINVYLHRMHNNGLLLALPIHVLLNGVEMLGGIESIEDCIPCIFVAKGVYPNGVWCV